MARYAVCRCGKPFRRTHNGQRYCSLECRRAAQLRDVGSPLDLRCSVCKACGLPFRQPQRGRHEYCQDCGGWTMPKSRPAVPRPLWSSVNPMHVQAEAGARGQHGAGRYPGPGVIGSTAMCDGLR